MEARVKATLVKKVRKEEGWMIIEVEENVTKYVKDAGERREVAQPIHIFVGKYHFEALSGWKAGEEREIDVLIKTEKKTSNAGNEFVNCDVEFTGIAKKEGMFKEVTSKNDDDYTL